MSDVPEPSPASRKERFKVLLSDWSVVLFYLCVVIMFIVSIVWVIIDDSRSSSDDNSHAHVSLTSTCVAPAEVTSATACANSRG